MALKDHPYLNLYSIHIPPAPPVESLKEEYGISPIADYTGQILNDALIEKMKEDILKATAIPEGYLMQGMDFAFGEDQTVGVKVTLKQADGEGNWKDISPLNLKLETVDIWHPTYTEETMENPFAGDPMFEE